MREYQELYFDRLFSVLFFCGVGGCALFFALMNSIFFIFLIIFAFLATYFFIDSILDRRQFYELDDFEKVEGFKYPKEEDYYKMYFKGSQYTI